MNPPVALSIAGSDPSGGAGIQADLKTFAAFGVYGAAVITALTAQNTTGVSAVHVPPVAFLAEQLDAVLGDLTVGACKTGMLADATVVATVARRAEEGRLARLVVDPVMVATSGDRLLEPAAEAAYLDQLFPWAAVITPNVHEAGLLLGRAIDDDADLAEAARELHRHGPAVVVVTGGDLQGMDAVDAVYDGTSLHFLCAPRVPTRHTHGTGCTFSAAIAAGLSRGAEAQAAIAQAKQYTTAALRAGASWCLGRGRGPLDHHVPPTVTTEGP